MGWSNNASAEVIYRVNSGGSLVSAIPDWETDTKGNPSTFVNAAATGDKTFSTGSAIDLSDPSIPVGTPEAIFQSERWDSTATPDEMQWEFPVTPGSYEVRLYFADIYSGTNAVGARVFDVTIEGVLVLDDYDIFADGGGFTGVMKSFVVTSDDNLNIEFGHGIENPAIKGIEIIQAGAGDLGVSPGSVDFGTVVLGNNAVQAVELTNLGSAGDSDIVVSGAQIIGADATEFSHDFVPSVTLGPGESTTVMAGFDPANSTGGKSASLEFTHDGNASPLMVTLSGNAMAGGGGGGSTVVYRVNSGGALVSATPDWGTDTKGNPSTFVNAAATGDKTFSTGSVIDLSDPSIPAGTPEAIFQSERWDPSAVPEMQWTFPVTPGSYEVRLYFADIYSGTNSVGARVFDVSIEGALVLDNYDIFADVGGFTGVMKSFVVTSDDNLDIDFGHGIDNPAIKGIEIIQAGAGDLGVSPGSVDFGMVVLGNNAVQAVELTNLGSAGDPDIVVSGAQIIGPDATEFSHDFSPSVTLAPGESMTVMAGFDPANQTGSKSASLEFTHDGNASPLVVVLTGNATAGGGGGSTSLYRVNSGGGLVSASPDWATDTKGNPSTFVNAAASGNKTFSTGSAIDLSNSSIPTGTPEAIFQSERWDPSAAPEMQWNFPVTPGSYEVRLYFADIYSGTNAVGARVFDVTIEGVLVLDDYDIFADVGGFTGVMKSFVVTSDDSLTINFGHGFDNPAIKGIEIIQGEAGGLGASPGGLDFGTVEVGTNGVQSVQLTNLGATGDPDIVVQSIALSGFDAADFSDDFVGPITVSAGQSITFNVTFSPTIVGNKTANLDIAHDGNNSPISISLTGIASNSIPVGFGKSTLQGIGIDNPTSLQFGPDGRLYVAQQNGLINAFTVIRNAANDYSVTATEAITDIQSIQNHDDDGTVNASVNDRLVTGINVTGTASSPVIFVNSSDPRIGGGPSGSDLDLDTNSGILSRLTWNGSSWDKLDLVVGLPRSEENHHGNGTVLDPATNMLYLGVAGNTNAGAKSNNFALATEFALSAAILSIDLDAIGETTHFLATLDDEDRPGVNDLNDPFGGNNGKNQAILAPGGPVQIHAPGFRNAYDLVITQMGDMYAIDNGPNAGWGDVPVGEGTTDCTNDINEPGLTYQDTMHLVTPGYYAGHTNPTRGNMANTFNPSNPQSPVSTSNTIECDYLIPGTENGALAIFSSSTNGLVEYTASNFGGAMLGDLLAASFSDQIFRLILNPDGTVLSNEALFSNVGNHPLDVTAQDDSGNLPGTIWVADIFGDAIVVFEPNDFDGGGAPCTGVYDPQLDEDGDGYDNADEIDNGTDPCSSADIPPDADGDFTSNLNDPDDDNDTLPDTSDPFAIDGNNGSATDLPIAYTWENDDPSPGGLLNLGFTGLMTNNTSNYEVLFDPTKMTAGGAAGVVTVDEISSGDAGHAAGDPDNQENGFQFGINVDESSNTFTAHTRIVGSFNGLTPEDFQSMGLFIGTGDQDNYVKIVLNANGGFGGVQLAKEENGVFSQPAQDSLTLPGPDTVDLYLEVEPSSLTVQASYEETTGGVTGLRTLLGSPEPIPATWLNGATKLAVGIISTSRGASSTFPGTWDFILVTNETTGPSGWQQAAPLPIALGEVAAGFIGNTMYLVGEGASDTLAYDVSTDTWSPLGSLASRPFAGHHHAAEVVNGNLYLISGLGSSSDGQVQIYDPIGDNWTVGASLSVLGGSGVSAVIGGKIYYAGGIFVNLVTTNQVRAYDPVIDSWSGSLAPMPQGVNHAAAATDGSKLYVFGGRDGSNVVSNGFDYLQIYDPVADSWVSSTDSGSTLAPLPQARGGMGKAVFFNGEFYLIGGETDTGANATANGVYDRVDIYNPVTNTWRLGDPMPTARHGIFPLLHTDKIHVAGGGVISGISQTTIFEVYNPN